MIPQESISVIMTVIWTSNKSLFLRLIRMHCLFVWSLYKHNVLDSVTIQKYFLCVCCHACYALLFVHWANESKYSLKFNLKIVYSEEDSRMFMLSKLHSHNILNLLKQTVWHSSLLKAFRATMKWVCRIN